ncbi:hypothetical protein [Salinirubrum litoreum]|uniref:RDD family protein n=1 Tax=Salinirubrum litoreum TaxID=1126234 RepID=A0ABD5R857_9EURY|nr:hypothetical protein [Salinirubrum litoreum]
MVLDVLLDVVADALRSYAPVVALVVPAYLGARIARGRPLTRRETLGYLFDVTVYSGVLGGSFGLVGLLLADAIALDRQTALVVAGVVGLVLYALVCWAAYVDTFRDSPPAFLGRLVGFRSG